LFESIITWNFLPHIHMFTKTHHKCDLLCQALSMCFSMYLSTSNLCKPSCCPPPAYPPIFLPFPNPPGCSPILIKYPLKIKSK
jgi:hypothetical protein